MNTVTFDDNTVNYMMLGAAGTGVIQPRATQSERLDEVTVRVGGGAFHRPTEGTIPCVCKDGRFGGESRLMPNAAGGSESLMVADDLTTKRYGQAAGSSTLEQYVALLTDLQSKGLPIGGHTAIERYGAPSGCGANDRLSAIYAYITNNADTLRHLATDVLGYDITDDQHVAIGKNAASRNEFSDGDALLGALRAKNGRVDVLEGEHIEVMAVINRRSGTTLDRDAMRNAFNGEYQAFNVDEWAFDAGARAIAGSDSAAEVQHKRIAMLYYNLATAGVLCGPSLRVVVLE